MRPKRDLAENVWYLINTAVNNGEPCRSSGCRVGAQRGASDLRVRVARGAGASVSFFIKPADGLQLPEIMKCRRALRFNWDDGRTGHIWGDRYGSRILDGEPPDWAEVYEFMAIDVPVRRGDWKREAARRGLGRKAGNAGAANRMRRADPGHGLMSPCNSRFTALQRLPASVTGANPSG
jgi:hypothetical protein